MTLHDPELHDLLRHIVADIAVVLLQSCAYIPVPRPEQYEDHDASCRTCQLLDKSWVLADLHHELARAEAEVLRATAWLLEDAHDYATTRLGYHWRDVETWTSQGQQILTAALKTGT